MDSQTVKFLRNLPYSQRIFQNFVTEKSSALTVHPCCYFLLFSFQLKIYYQRRTKEKNSADAV